MKHPVPIPIQSITFWLNAFIPRDILGNTTTLREGPYKGLTVVMIDSCYLTDQRNFSNDLRARSRMHSAVTLNFTGSAPTIRQSHRCDYTTECNPDNGEVINQRKESTRRMGFVLTATEPNILIRMDCRVAGPLESGERGFSEIEYKGIIEINLEARSIDIRIMICLFPAFEAYAAINDGVGAILFRHSPPAGILQIRLPEGANRRIRSRLEDRDGDGIFELPRG